MKHNFRVTLFLMLLYFSAQIVGLFLLQQSIQVIDVDEQGNIEVVYTEPITGRPDIEGQSSFIYVFFMIIFGTILLLILIKFKLFKLWKAWFFLAIFLALAISFSVVIPDIPALIAAFILAYFKLFKPNIIIHNFTEVFIYGGIAIMIAPLFTVFWMILLLIAISIYDAIAVWKLKHMITLATAQAEEKMFAGLLIPYKADTMPKVKPQKPVKTKKTVKPVSKLEVPTDITAQENKSAILGGGDIAFPLLFAGSVMTALIQGGYTVHQAFFQSLLIPLFSGLALFLLFVYSKKDKFYPAMPFISAGCFVGYIIIVLI